MCVKCGSSLPSFTSSLLQCQVFTVRELNIDPLVSHVPVFLHTTHVKQPSLEPSPLGSQTTHSLQ